ncbi:MAG: hypothetical protein KDE22_00510 [Rhodobacterales bacterium]|nr:hypothetical protein [Rhodobacterales bacterium]
MSKAVFLSAGILIALYAGLAYLIGGPDSSAFDATPFGAFAAGAFLLSFIIFGPSLGTTQADAPDRAPERAPGHAPGRAPDREPKGPDFVAFLALAEEGGASSHRSPDGKAQLAARLREHFNLDPHMPVRLIWPELWMTERDAKVARNMMAASAMPLGTGPAVGPMAMGDLLRKRAAVVLTSQPMPADLANRIREDQKDWRFAKVPRGLVFGRVHGESRIGLGDRVGGGPPATGDGAAATDPAADVFAFLIPKHKSLAVRKGIGGIKPETEAITIAKTRELLGDAQARILVVHPDEWTGPDLRAIEDATDSIARIKLAAAVTTSLEAKGIGQSRILAFVTGDVDCIELPDVGLFLLYGPLRPSGEAPPVNDGSHPPDPPLGADHPVSIIVGFVLHPEDSPAAAAAFVADLRPGALEDRLRRELSMPGAGVTIYPAGDWLAPRIATADRIHDQKTLREINNGAFVRVLADGMDPDLAWAQMADGVYETLVLPETGRVVLFRVLNGPAGKLGRLAEQRA